MIFLRKIFFPFAILYWGITYLRNCLYDLGFFRSQSYKIPIIAVGNLSVGGTGKTPQIEYLIRLLKKYKIATLSRGYKRKTKGFVLADKTASSESIGDEPFQFFTKFPKVFVAVDADRRNGISKLMSLGSEVILLDDAFQHRKVRAGFYILLTAYNDLFCDDYILPFGNLRESSLGKKRANMIIVTKCPPDISEISKNKIREKLKAKVPVFFSFIDYDEFVYDKKKQIKLELSEIKGKTFNVAGIAKPQPFFDFLNAKNEDCLVFPDHHDFTEVDVALIRKMAGKKKIVTTEKDYVRLKDKLTDLDLYYLPIKSKLVEEEERFNKIILDYVGKNSGDGSFFK